MILIGGQTLGMLATHLLPAGVASVFGSAAPIFLALFASAVLREPLGLREVCGVGLGFAGLALMGWFASAGGGFSPLGASASWAGGSLWARRLRLPDDPVMALAAQLVATVTVRALVVGATGIVGRTNFAELPTTAWWALAYLVVASTLVGYIVFLAVNADVSPTVANTSITPRPWSRCCCPLQC